MAVAVRAVRVGELLALGLLAGGVVWSVPAGLFFVTGVLVVGCGVLVWRLLRTGTAVWLIAVAGALPVMLVLAFFVSIFSSGGLVPQD
jgi:hypothetical protein